LRDSLLVCPAEVLPLMLPPDPEKIRSPVPHVEYIQKYPSRGSFRISPVVPSITIVYVALSSSMLRDWAFF